MDGKLPRDNVLIELIEKEPLLLTIKRKKFVRVRILSTGSSVDSVKPGDIVICHNEGRIIEHNGRRARFISDDSLILKEN